MTETTESTANLYAAKSQSFLGMHIFMEAWENLKSYTSIWIRENKMLMSYITIHFSENDALQSTYLRNKMYYLFDKYLRLDISPFLCIRGNAGHTKIVYTIDKSNSWVINYIVFNFSQNYKIRNENLLWK